MRHSEYTALFRNAAKNNRKLAHELNGRTSFARIVLTAFPTPELQIMEFLNSIRNEMSYPCLLLQSYEYTFPDNKSNNLYRDKSGAFIILYEYAGGDEYDDIEVKKDEAEILGDEIVTHLKKYWESRANIGYFDLNQTNGETVMLPEFNLIGVRINFPFKTKANAELKYDPEKWFTPL